MQPPSQVRSKNPTLRVARIKVNIDTATSLNRLGTRREPCFSKTTHHGVLDALSPTIVERSEVFFMSVGLVFMSSAKDSGKVSKGGGSQARAGNVADASAGVAKPLLVANGSKSHAECLERYPKKMLMHGVHAFLFPPHL